MPRSFGPGQGHRPGGRLDAHFPVPVTGPGSGVLAGRGPLVAIAAGELGDLGLQGGLHQQLRAEPGDLLQDLRKRLVLGEQFIDMVADTSAGDTRCDTGMGPSLR